MDWTYCPLVALENDLIRPDGSLSVRDFIQNIL